MAGRLFTFCKELVGIYPDSTETDSDTDSDSSTSSTRSSDSPDTEAAYSLDIKVADSPDAEAAADVDSNTKNTEVADSPGAKAATDVEPDDNTEVADPPDAKIANSPETKVAVSLEAKVPDSPDAKAATDVKLDDNGTAATAANNDDAKVEEVNSDIASGSQQENTTQAAIEAWYAAALVRVEARLATADARLIGLAGDLARADCAIFKKEQEHLWLYGKLSSLHEEYSKRHEELTKQNQELERVVEESSPEAEADMALLLLYLSRAAVDISGTAKQDAENVLKRADLDWEAYKRGYPLGDEGDAPDAGGTE